MKKIIRLVSFMLLTVFYYTVTAQTPTQIKNKKIADSIFKLTHPGHYVPDSMIYVTGENGRTKIFRDSLHKKNDSFIYLKRKLSDSSFKAFNIEKKNLLIRKDSLNKKMFALNRSIDTLKRKMMSSNWSMDTLYRKKMFIARKSDSLQRLHKISMFKYDSLKSLHIEKFKADSFHKSKLFVSQKFDSARRSFKLNRLKSDSLRGLNKLSIDSMHKFKLFKSVRLDSMKRELYLQNIKTDSVRIKKYLQSKKIQLQQYRDTAALKEGYRSRDLSMEITCNYGDTLFIRNVYKKIIIKTVPNQRVKLLAKIEYKDEINDRDVAVFKMMGITVLRDTKKLTAIINGVKPTKDKNDKADNSLSALSPLYADINTESNTKRALYMEVPENVFIYLDTKYADCDIENYVKNVSANITNGSLKMASADIAAIQSKYSTIHANEIKNASLNFSTTKFTASNIVSMTVVSTASNMQIENCNAMALNSKSDEYKIDKAGSISGNKDFGKLNIESLKDELVLKGANTDVKVTSFNYASPFIKIDSKYADVKLPLYDQKNYAVYYEGSYNDVNKLSTAAQKITGTGNVTAVYSLQKDTAVATKASNATKTKFEATAGDITGKHTKIDIVCPFCNVVFN